MDIIKENTIKTKKFGLPEFTEFLINAFDAKQISDGLVKSLMENVKDLPLNDYLSIRSFGKYEGVEKIRKFLEENLAAISNLPTYNVYINFEKYNGVDENTVNAFSNESEVPSLLSEVSRAFFEKEVVSKNRSISKSVLLENIIYKLSKKLFESNNINHNIKKIMENKSFYDGEKFLKVSDFKGEKKCLKEEHLHELNKKLNFIFENVNSKFLNRLDVLKNVLNESGGKNIDNDMLLEIYTICHKIEEKIGTRKNNDSSSE